MWGDQDDVREVRRTALRLADALRAEAVTMASAGHVQWNSPAAHAFLGVLADEVGAARRCADDLERAAGLLEAHARSVDRNLGGLRTLGVGG